MTDVTTTIPILDAFAGVAARHPDKVAIHTPESSVTLRELDLVTNRLARTIPASPERTPVAVLCDDAVDFQAGQLAVFKAGRPVVRIHTDLPSARMAVILDQAGVDTVILSAGQEVDPILDGRTIIHMSDLATDDAPVTPDVQPDDPALILYTSGSTGVPKGMVHTYGSLHARSAAFIWAFELTGNDRMLLISRLGTLEMVASFISGATLHPFDVRARGVPGLAAWIRDQRITVFRTPPSVLRNLVAEIGDNQYPDLRVVGQAGERLSPRDVDRFRSAFEPHTALVHFYGASESGVVTAQVVDRSFDTGSALVPAGKPAPGITVTIENPLGTPVAAGESGLIVVQGPSLASGYYRRDDLTAERFFGEGPERRFVSGDTGRWDEHGRLEVLGRDDDQVKVAGGHRVELAEVEEALRHLDGIDEAAVVARHDKSGSNLLVAYYTHRDPPPRVTDLRRALADRLPAYMIPSRWVPVEAFARALPTEKIDRQALPDPPPFPGHDHETVAGRMAAIWTDLLGVHDMHETDSFFALGGDSMAAAALVAAVEEAFDCRIEMADLFGDDTFGSMVAAVEASQGVTPDGPLFALKRSGDLRPLHCIHMPGWGRLRYLVLSRAIDERRPMIGVADDETPAIPKPRSLGKIADRYATAIRESFDGPYLLLGHSAGGTLAYEVARRLVKGGGEVDFVGLLDSPYPGSRPSLWTRIRQAVGRHGVIGVTKIAVVRGMRRIGLRPKPVRGKRTVPKSIRKRLRRVHELHRVTPADLPATYFRGTETAQEPHHARHWKRLGATIIDVPGKHGTILKANRIGELATRLEEAIGDAMGAFSP